MTDQSPTAAFTASSFLDGANADYVDQLAARHAQDPNSVDPQWAEFFRALGDSELDLRDNRVISGVEMKKLCTTLADMDEAFGSQAAGTTAPRPIELPAGTQIQVRLDHEVSSRTARMVWAKWSAPPSARSSRPKRCSGSAGPHWPLWSRACWWR